MSDLLPGDLWRRLSSTELPKLWVPKRENIYQIEAIPTLGTGKLDLLPTLMCPARLLEKTGHLARS